MIERDILNWIDIRESMQNLEIYRNKTKIKFFNFFRVILSYKSFGAGFYMFFKFFFFLQIMMLTLTNIEDKKDSAIVLLNYVSNVIFIQDIIKDKKSYNLSILSLTLLTLFIICLIIYILISIKIDKFYLYLPLWVLNFLNILLLNYLSGPIIHICLLITNCNNEYNKHIFLNKKCYKDTLHIIFFILSIINCLFLTIYCNILSVYYNQIGSVSENNQTGRINCLYEFYSLICKNILFIFAYILKYKSDDKNILRYIMQILIFLISLSFSLYCYKNVYYYDNRLNTLCLYGWCFITWYSFVIILKCLLGIYDTSIFHISGWILIIFILYYIEEHKEEYLLTDFNIFEANSLKEIEIFNNKIFNLISVRSIKNTTLLLGLIEKFERYFKTLPEMNDKYIKLLSDPILKKKFNDSSDLHVLSIVYIIYDYHLEKSSFKNDILLVMSYFLMNKFKKAYYAISLCSKIKVSNSIISYFKFILMEQIKEYLIFKITKSVNKENIKHVQIGSVILYYIYIDLFRLKIFDAACNQIDYFDNLRNNNINSNTTKNFLKIGKEILKLRNQILTLWKKILELNPFSDESEKDYMLYLETIMQDDTLAKLESKRFQNLKNNKLSERTNVYHSMFIRENSSVILSDGYNNLGKILYFSPNFSEIFNFNEREISNYYVNDLIPDIISQFHNELIEHAVKFSMLGKYFSKPYDTLLKSKNKGIYNIKIYVKVLPNFTYGLIYINYLTKNLENNFIIVLDDKLNINCFTDFANLSNQNSNLNSNYGLTKSIIGHNIAMLIPNIFKHIEYSKKTEKFYFRKTEIEFEGTLYPIISWKELEEKIFNVYEIIKKKGRLNFDDDNHRDSIKEYDELIHEITSKYQKGFSIFYRIFTKKLLNNKYVYHRIYISNDLIALNENINSLNASAIDDDDNNNNDKIFNDNKKFIKLKGIGFDSELNTLLKPENVLNNNGNLNLNQNLNDIKNNNNNNINIDINNNNKTPNKEIDVTSSVSNSNNVDSASFNRLKNSILEGKEVTYIKIMRYLGFLYGIVTLLFIYLSFYSSKSSLNILYDYLNENLLFNRSKIATSCIYTNSMNLLLSKFKIYPENICYIKENCSDFFIDRFSECIEYLEHIKENTTYYSYDFLKILRKNVLVEISIYYPQDKNVNNSFNISEDSLLSLVVATGLELINDINYYFEKYYSSYDTLITNIKEESILLLYDENLIGFYGKEKENKAKKIKSKLEDYPLICEIIIFILFMFSFCFLIFKVNSLENIYLECLIRFNSINFELYIKTLDNLKSKLRNENSNEEEKDEEEKFEEDNENEENDEKNKDNKKDKKNNKDNKDNKDKKGKKNDIKTEEKKKHKDKIVKQNVLKKQKIKAMTQYFFKWNIIFIIRVALTFIVSLSYFILMFVLERRYKKNIIDLDSNINNIENVYKESFYIFLYIKKTIHDFFHFDIKKQNIVYLLENNYYDSYLFENSNYTINDINNIKTLENDKFNFIDESLITTPKLGNLIMPILNDKSLNKEILNTLNILYSDDACAILYNVSSDYYNICSNFWSSIITKGMEQSITQMGIILNTVIDELKSVKNGKKTVYDLLNINSSYSQFEFFVNYYLLDGFWESDKLFNEIKKKKIEKIDSYYLLIFAIYSIVNLVLIVLVNKLVYTSRDMLNSFLNFVGILPIKYIIEDPNLLSEILELEQTIY